MDRPPTKGTLGSTATAVPFRPEVYTGREKFTVMGRGSIGGKANGLARAAPILDFAIAPVFEPAIKPDVPLLTVISTEHFDRFMDKNESSLRAAEGLEDEQILSAFAEAELPKDLLSNLEVFLKHLRCPLAVRSSSLLEDTLAAPFAGVYATQMIPNDQADPRDRLKCLAKAIKRVYASAFLKKARDYRLAARCAGEEKMAVVIQELVGSRRNDRFYPQISGAARSCNYYPLGPAKPEEGVVDLALGLGRTIVEDGVSWSYSPAYPHVNPPHNALQEILKQTQKEFWALQMTGEGCVAPPAGGGYLAKYSLSAAEQDGSLTFLASTYKQEDDRIVPGLDASGPRLVDFGRILKGGALPLNDLLRKLLEACAELFRIAVEIEFALTFDDQSPSPARFALLQVRPMEPRGMPPRSLEPGDMTGDEVLFSSDSVLGHGAADSIQDVLYVKPVRFSSTHTRSIAAEVEGVNRRLVEERRPYLLIGLGRWGSSDPSAGIPVRFEQIAGARVIVESALPSMRYMPSQGSHFFHNLTSARVLYFSMGTPDYRDVDWKWLDAQPALEETDFLRLVRTGRPLWIRVDGRSGRGVIRKG